jgi:hypothetical protein
MTLRTYSRSLDVAVAVTISADIASRDVDLHHPAADRGPERNIDLVLKIGPRLRPLVHGLTARAARKDVGEDVAKPAARAARTLTASPARALKQIRKIKAPEVDIAGSARGAPSARKSSRKVASARLPATASVGLRRSRINIVGIEPQLIVNLPLLGVAEDVIGFRKSLELFFSSLVPGINVRMVLACKLAKRLANVVRRCGLLYTENGIIIFIFGCGGHWSSCQCPAPGERVD